jgi:hypothetical protein
MATKKKKNSQKSKSKASNKKKTNRCWPGYEPTPGKKPGSKGSCKPKKS